MSDISLVEEFELFLDYNFMPKLSNGKIRVEILNAIVGGYSFRIDRGLTQEEFAKYKGISLEVVKDIEIGKCYDLLLISKYCE